MLVKIIGKHIYKKALNVGIEKALQPFVTPCRQYKF